MAVASILVVGLVAAACGGDASTPEPAEQSTPAAATSEAPGAGTAAAATAVASAATATAVASTAPASATAFARTATHASTDDPAATYPLTAGRYRMQWNTTDCEQVDILVSQVDGEFTYPKPSRSSFATATINDLPEGSYTIEQLDPDCTEWTIRVDWMTN
jgi:hypothetical protein